MRLLTILAEHHEKLIRKFIEGASVTVRGHGFFGQFFYIRCLYDPREHQFADAFAYFLEDIVLNENPVYSRLPKLRDAADKLRRTNTGTKEHLRRYLRQHKELNVEGYAAFRMDEFKHRLDMLMIGLIKRLKLT